MLTSIKGANGGVGKLAVQLAKISGYSVVAVTSNKESMAQVKARGADHVFANTDSDIVAKIHAAAPNLHCAFDTVVEAETMAKIIQCCEKPATVATAIKYLGEDIKGVKTVPVYSGEVLGKTPTGETSIAGLELGKWLWENLNQWLRERKVTPIEHEKVEGLETVNGGLKRMKHGTARAKLALYVL
jgi:NADPH:quinone reductase-like Zn-dependent oxidoreductase